MSKLKKSDIKYQTDEYLQDIRSKTYKIISQIENEENISEEIKLLAEINKTSMFMICRLSSQIDNLNYEIKNLNRIIYQLD